MLSLTKLLTGDAYFGDDLRYTPASRRAQNGVAEGRGPVVSWNCTRTCNLQCRHCYANSESKRYEGELTTEEALAFIDDLAAFNVPVILFTGGEPLMREDLFTLTAYAREKGIRATLSTNGTLITPEMARTIKDHGIGYVGISIDGDPAVNDAFRGVEGAYSRALAGIRNCRAVGQRVGLLRWRRCWICSNTKISTASASIIWCIPGAVPPFRRKTLPHRKPVPWWT